MVRLPVTSSVPPEAVIVLVPVVKLMPSVPEPVTLVLDDKEPRPLRVPPERVIPEASVRTAPLSTVRVPLVTVCAPLSVVLAAISSVLFDVSTVTALTVAPLLLSFSTDPDTLAIASVVVVSTAPVRFRVPPEAVTVRPRTGRLTLPLPLTAVAAEIVPTPERVPPERVIPEASVRTAPLSTVSVPLVTLCAPLSVVLAAISSVLFDVSTVTALTVAPLLLSFSTDPDTLAIASVVVVSTLPVRFSVPPEAVTVRPTTDRLSVPLPVTAVVAEIVPAPERVPPERVIPEASVRTAPLSTISVPLVTV